jgi:glutathione-dependent peroxiredoxin
MPTHREGQRVPDVTFKTRANGAWKDVTTDDIFKGKTVVVFALPGAYTPTCSANHLPRYNELAATLKRHGVDDVVCIAVNDAFVMNEWTRSQEAGNITMLPDGNGKFAEGMGMLVDKSDMGLGKRSWRYSMLVRDGVIQKMFIEPDTGEDPLEVSDADTMLRYVAPDASPPPAISMFTKRGCMFCARARKTLQQAGLEFEEIELGHGVGHRSLMAVAGASTTPQVFIDGEKVGGSEALEEWLDRKAARSKEAVES